MVDGGGGGAATFANASKETRISTPANSGAAAPGAFDPMKATRIGTAQANTQAPYAQPNAYGQPAGHGQPAQQQRQQQHYQP